MNSPHGRVGQRVQRRIIKHGLKARYAAYLVATTWVLAILVFGVLEYLVDRNTFGNAWLGMWWAVQTVTTVGYGDVVPGQTAGKVVATLLMVGGLSFLAVITGLITSLFVTIAQNERRAAGEDPVMQQLEQISAEVSSLRAELSRTRPGSG